MTEKKHSEMIIKRLHALFYKQHFYKQHQAEIGERSSKC